MSESLSEAAFSQWAAIQATKRNLAYHSGSIRSGGDSLWPSSLFSVSFISRCACFEIEDGERRRALVLRTGDGHPFPTAPE